MEEPARIEQGRDKNVGMGGRRDNREGDEGLMNLNPHLTCIQFHNCLSA